LDPCPRDWTWPSRPAWSQGRDVWTVACAGGMCDSYTATQAFVEIDNKLFKHQAWVSPSKVCGHVLSFSLLVASNVGSIYSPDSSLHSCFAMLPIARSKADIYTCLNSRMLTVQWLFCSWIILFSRFQAKTFISVVNKGNYVTNLGTARSIVLFST
jgi:hypothetical protein